MVATGINILVRSERISPKVLVIYLDGDATSCLTELVDEKYEVRSRDFNELFEIIHWPHDILITCSDYELCSKEEMYAAVRQALNITDYDRKVMLFTEWGIFRDDMACSIPAIHKLTNCYSVYDNYGWYVWHCGKKNNV